MTNQQASKLLSEAKHRAQLASEQGKKIAIRDYFVIHIALATGLRVMEIAALKCGDLSQDANACYLLVHKGKGNKKRIVYFNREFKTHCQNYLEWKQAMGESIDPENPLIVSSNTGTHMTTRAMQKMFKRCAQRASLSKNHSIHSARHSHACFLLKASQWNLRLVQKQLGHARIVTTQVYADVMQSDIENTMNRMRQMYQ